jgi:tRNA A37 threonylcarbamoyladenosine synthetase subunit TsaC/SUA5/YrdC
LTIAVAARRGLDARLLVGDAVAVRLPGPSDASEIARAFGAPLTATSANVADGPPCRRAAEVERCFAAEVERNELLVVSGEAQGEAPSTVVAVECGRLRIVRVGRITQMELAEQGS